MEIQWQNKNLINIVNINKKIKSSLFQEGSLTRYLQQNCKGAFTIELASEAWQLPNRNEAMLLNLSNQEKTFVRESWLKSDEQPLVYARTVIPKKTLSGETSILTNLGTTPLGEILFADKTTYRSNIRYAKIPSDCYLYRSATIHSKIDEDVWGRQSLFHIKSKPLLISEIFLPELSKCIQ